MERRESNGEKREEEECAREVRRRKSSRKGKENCAGMRGIITATLSAGILLDFRDTTIFSRILKLNLNLELNTCLYR